MSTPIDGFYGDYDFLSNFCPCYVTVDEITYKSAEAAYQAAKTNDIGHKKFFATLPAGLAKRYGREHIVLPKDWEERKYDIMLEVVRKKFQQNGDFKRLLLDTGESMLIETNSWGDTYWGVCDGIGYNYLGDILMRVRDEIRAGGEY